MGRWQRLLWIRHWQSNKTNSQFSPWQSLYAKSVLKILINKLGINQQQDVIVLAMQIAINNSICI